MGKTKEQFSGADCFARLALELPHLQAMAKWQVWAVVMHAVAQSLELDCVEVSGSTESRKEQMIAKVSLPPDWMSQNRANARFTYVHANDTTRYFVVTFQEKQGNKIEAKLEKQKKSPSITEFAVPTIAKFIEMADLPADLSSLGESGNAPWSPEAEPIRIFKEFIKKEVLQQAQQPPSGGLFQNPNSSFFQGGQPASVQPQSTGQRPQGSSLMAGPQPNPYFSTGGGGGGLRIIGDPPMSMGGIPTLGGVSGNLVGPNSAIFGGGRGNPGFMPQPGGGGLGPFPPGGFSGVNPMGNDGLMGPAGMMYQPDGVNDLDPGLPNNPLAMPNRGGPQQPGFFGPGGNLMGPGRNPMGGPGGPGGNMYM